MCGIAGWIDWRHDLRAEQAAIDAMTATMACRGPDDSGTWISPRAALGHRRLAVIDPAGGAQPMSWVPDGGDADTAVDQSVVLTFNGEIYNYRELRCDLASRGHRFRTASDTEVLLHAYLEWGAGFVHRLDGIFAFGIWDAGEQRLLLARDPLGVKPLYWSPLADGVVFGSEPKALFASRRVEAEIDDDGLRLLFAMFGTHEPGVCPLRGVREVEPGHTITVSPSGVVDSCYWRLEARPHEDDEQSTVETVRELLTAAVERQLVADVPVCTLVSGGLDSSVITALSSRAGSREQLRTFSVDFTGSARDFAATDIRPDLDAPFVRKLVAHLGTDHTEIVLDVPELIATQRWATRARDLPSLGDLDASLILLFEAVKNHATVALSGESADELFGGYAWFHDPQAISRAMYPWAPPGAGLAEVLSPALQRTLRPAEFLADRYAAAIATVPRLPGEKAEERRRREVTFLALTRYLPVLLDRKDRMSMAVGLEVRVPFCDTKLVEYVWNAPWHQKTLGGTPKGLLRRAAADLLPSELVERRKSVFPAPADPNYDSRLRDATRALLKGSRVGELVAPERILAITDSTTAKPAWQQRMAMAYLLQIEYWLERYRVRLLTEA